MKLVLVSIISFTFSISDAIGQIQGKVVYEQYGLEFTIPDDWVGQESEDAIYIGSNTLPGLVILSIHNYTKPQLIDMAKSGLSEPGTYLKLTGELDDLDDSSIGGLFQGTIENENAKAYIIGIGSENKQVGITIMSAANSNVYSDTNRKVAEELYSSFKFKEKSAGSSSDELQEWIDWFKNVRLVYLDSYYSSGSVGGGYSSEERIDLCGKGYFNFSSSSEVTVSGSGISGYNRGSDQGNGIWEVIQNGATYVLRLKYYDGSVSSYELEYTEEKLFLDGYRYYRITEGEERPNCY